MKKRMCKKCGKRIEGYTEKQVRHMLIQHITACHPEDVTIEGLDE